MNCIQIQKSQLHHFALYKLTDEVGGLHHIGVQTFAYMLGVVDALPVIPEHPLYLTVLQTDADLFKLLQVGVNMADELKRSDLKIRLQEKFVEYKKNKLSHARAIRCIDSGEQFDSVTAAAKAHDLNYSSLSKHLSGQKSYDTVKGRRYEYAD